MSLNTASPILKTQNNIKTIIHRCYWQQGEAGNILLLFFPSYKNGSHISCKAIFGKGLQAACCSKSNIQVFSRPSALQAAFALVKLEKNSLHSRVLLLVIYVTFLSKDTSDISVFIHQYNVSTSAFLYPLK